MRPLLRRFSKLVRTVPRDWDDWNVALASLAFCLASARADFVFVYNIAFSCINQVVSLGGSMITKCKLWHIK